MFSDPIRRAALFGVVLLAACTPRIDGVEQPSALGIGKPLTVFAVSTRARQDDGSYGWSRSATPDLLELTVSIPPDRVTGQIAYNPTNPDPTHDFTIANRQKIDDPNRFTKRLSAALAERPRGSRELTIFVHGYNSTQAESAFRVAQVAEDIAVPGIKSIYSWPSLGTPLGYVHDHDSLLFARDGLESMLRMAVQARPERLLLVAHSMGALLSMETLRQIEIEEPGWTATNLGGVILISPDVDVEVFRQQIERFDTLPQPFLVFVSRRDPALNLSAALRGTPEDKRLGNLSNTDKIADLPITVIDTTAYASDAKSQHLVAATSPTLIALLRDVSSTNAILDTDGPTNGPLAGLPLLQSGSERPLLGDER